MPSLWLSQQPRQTETRAPLGHLPRWGPTATVPHLMTFREGPSVTGDGFSVLLSLCKPQVLCVKLSAGRTQKGPNTSSHWPLEGQWPGLVCPMGSYEERLCHLSGSSCPSLREPGV